MKHRKVSAFFLSICTSAAALSPMYSYAEVHQDGQGRMIFDTWQEAYRRELAQFQQTPSFHNQLQYQDSCSMYEIKDVTGDDVPELFISEGGEFESKASIFTFDILTGECVYLMKGGNYGQIGCDKSSSHDGIYFINSAVNPITSVRNTEIYVYNNRATSPIATFTDNELVESDPNIAEYTMNGQKVMKSVYDSELAKYKDLNFEYFGRKQLFEDLYEDGGEIIYGYYFDHYEITGCDHSMTSAKIKDEINGLKVTKIQAYNFENCPNLESIEIGRNIESIGKYGFTKCPKLTSITIPASVRNIDEYAFLDCPSLSEVTILNPDCNIWDHWEDGYPVTFVNDIDQDNHTVFTGTIKGYPNSSAEKYTKIFNLKFEPLSGLEPSGNYILGDVNDDRILDGKDATAILTAYAKSSVEGGELGFNETQKLAADVNKDNIIDGKDATAVLTFYAKSSVGYTGTLEEFLNIKSTSENFPYGRFTSGLESDTEAIDFLNGTWHMLGKGNPLTLESTKTNMGIDADTYKMEIKTEKEQMTGGVNGLKGLFDIPRGCYNLLTSHINFVSQRFSDDPSQSLDVDTDFLFIGTYINGSKKMAVRNIGNGITDVVTKLDENKKTSSGYWVFSDENNDPIGTTDEIYDKMRIKGKSFYAFRWLDMGDEVYLQEMDVHKQTEDLVEGAQPSETLIYGYPNNGHAMSAVKYYVKDAQELANSGAYKPGLVKVTTDKDGKVIGIKELEYITLGRYKPDTAPAETTTSSTTTVTTTTTATSAKNSTTSSASTKAGTSSTSTKSTTASSVNTSSKTSTSNTTSTTSKTNSSTTSKTADSTTTSSSVSSTSKTVNSTTTSSSTSSTSKKSSTTSASTTTTTTTTAPVTTSDAWKKLYTAAAAEFEADNNGSTFKLININADGIPELYARDTHDAGALWTIVNGNLIKIQKWEGSRSGSVMNYDEKKHTFVIYNSSSASTYSYEIWKLDDSGNLSKVKVFSSVEGSCKIDGNSVTETYFSSMSEAEVFSQRSAYDPANELTYKELKSKLA